MRRLLRGGATGSGKPSTLLWVLSLCAVLALVAAGSWHAGERARGTTYLGSTRFDTAQAYWEKEIKLKGVSESVDELIETGNTLSPPREAHVLAHAFGSALYAVNGLKSLSDCPDAFFWGCAHQFIGEALVRDGLAVIPKLFSACGSESPEKRACMHSIGHGLVGYFGYEEEPLNDALSLCYSYSTSTYGGCLAGSFMEYNLRFLSLADLDGTLDVRTVDQRHLYEPCISSIDEPFRTACASELPRWWYFAAWADKDFASVAGEVGSRCSGISEGLRRACFEGLGTFASFSTSADVNPERAIAICSGLEQPALERLYCTTGVVLHMNYWNMPGYMDVCGRSGFDGEYLRYCESYASTEIEELGSISPPSP